MQRRILIPPELAGLPEQLPQGELLELSGQTMGTSWQLRWVAQPGISAPQVLALVQAAHAQVVAEMSTWQADSWLSLYNRAAAGSWHSMPTHAAAVLACALEVAADSAGAFDPSVGALVELWGFGPRPPQHLPPAAEDIARLKASSGWQRLQLRDGQALQPGGLSVDLSGIAKGYAVDLVAERLRAHGVQNFLVEIGGELYGYGIKPDGQPWWVALEEPAAAQAQALAALHAMAVATSGDYRRYFEADGTRYAHTLDPRSGYPVAQAPSAVTVLHPSCMHADAYATALTVLGVQAGLAYATQLGIAVRFTGHTQAGSLQHHSPAWLAMEQDEAA